jgi:GNAT superfamily N-acetyltransferase
VSDAPFVAGPLSTFHDRNSFTCGVEPLDKYFRQQASQDIRRRIATCFVLTEAASGAIAGYYTLAATNVLTSQLPQVVTAKLPRYAAIPAVLIGRLAVSTEFRGRKLGSVLLADAVSRAARADIATFAVDRSALLPTPRVRRPSTRPPDVHPHRVRATVLPLAGSIKP